jgi:hypothetical protein
VPVQTAAGAVVPHCGPRISMGGSLLDIAQRDPGIERGGQERVSVCGVTALALTARRAILRTIGPAPCRSSRRPSAARNTGPSVRSPMARSIARAVRGASEIVTTVPPLRVIVSVRCPRSRPRCSMSAPVASETRSPFRASREISACSDAEPGPAATSSAPSSLRSSATARLVVQSRSPDVGRRGVIQEFFPDCVPVEPGDGAPPPGDRGPCSSSCFQVPGEAFDVGAADGEQVLGTGAAPRGEFGAGRARRHLW